MTAANGDFGFLEILRGNMSPPLKSPEPLSHDNLPRRNSLGKDLWYYIEHFYDTGSNVLTHKSIVKMLDTSPEPGTPRKYKFLLPDGTLNGISYYIRDTDRIYKCKYLKCQATGEIEQEGGRNKRKRYSITRHKKNKHRKYSRKH
jgi:hypothetical protein